MGAHTASQSALRQAGANITDGLTKSLAAKDGDVRPLRDFVAEEVLAANEPNKQIKTTTMAVTQTIIADPTLSDSEKEETVDTRGRK